MQQLTGAAGGYLVGLVPHHGAVNLGQGFPDFDCDSSLVDAVSNAMRAGLKAAIELGADSGLKRIGAGNYGGKLGQHHIHLHRVLKDRP